MVIKIPTIVAVLFIGYNTFYSRYLSAMRLATMISTTLITSLITLFCGVLHTEIEYLHHYTSLYSMSLGIVICIISLLPAKSQSAQSDAVTYEIYRKYNNKGCPTQC